VSVPPPPVTPPYPSLAPPTKDILNSTMTTTRMTYYSIVSSPSTTHKHPHHFHNPTPRPHSTITSSTVSQNPD
jgi:hypothetical protein